MQGLLLIKCQYFTCDENTCFNNDIPHPDFCISGWVDMDLLCFNKPPQPKYLKS